MGTRKNRLALGLLLLLQTMTTHATAYRVEGHYHFWMHIEEIGFKGEAFLTYSSRRTATPIDEESTYEGGWFVLEDVHGLKGWDRVNDGPWQRMVVPLRGFSPAVVLDMYEFCNPDLYDDCPPLYDDVLQSVGPMSCDAART